MPQPIPYEALVARNLRMARAAVQISQDDVAARMSALGFPWHRQTVQRCENATRHVHAAELIGLMLVFEVDLTALAYPPGEGTPVALPSGAQIALPAARFGPAVHPARSVWPR